MPSPPFHHHNWAFTFKIPPPSKIHLSSVRKLNAILALSNCWFDSILPDTWSSNIYPYTLSLPDALSTQQSRFPFPSDTAWQILFETLHEIQLKSNSIPSLLARYVYLFVHVKPSQTPFTILTMPWMSSSCKFCTCSCNYHASHGQNVIAWPNSLDNPFHILHLCSIHMLTCTSTPKTHRSLSLATSSLFNIESSKLPQASFHHQFLFTKPNRADHCSIKLLPFNLWT